MEWFDWVNNPEAWIALLTLTVLELVLGIDNIVFISILAAKLPKEQQNRARIVGLGMAMGARIVLLFFLTWLIGLTEPLFPVFGHEVSGKDLIMLGGGLFLLAKATHEIHQKLEGEHGHSSSRVKAAFWSVITQIVMLDIVFSLDSVITAAGMARDLAVMIIAVMIAIGAMMIFAKPVGEFVDRHPTVKMLALSFLLLIGFTLVADGLGQHIPKGYIYFAMGFSVLVEALNLWAKKKKRNPVQLHEPYKREGVRYS